MELAQQLLNDQKYNFFLEREKYSEIFNNCGVYFISNNLNNDLYIGSSRNIKNRFYNHKSSLRNNRHKNKHLQNAWNLYGEENFTFKVVEQHHDIDNILFREKKLISIFNPNYNIKQVDCNSFYHSEETKIKISEKSKEKYIKNPSLVGKIREIGLRSAIYNKGRKHTKKAKENMSIAAKKRGCSHLRSEKVVSKLLKSRELTRKKVVAIKDGVEYMVFDSITNAALFVNGNTGNIVTGIQKNKIRYGYYWKYKF
jgi:group I intron endonuclease